MTKMGFGTDLQSMEQRNSDLKKKTEISLKQNEGLA